MSRVEVRGCWQNKNKQTNEQTPKGKKHRVRRAKRNEGEAKVEKKKRMKE